MHCVPVIFQFLSICKKGSSAPESAVAGIVLILFILVLMLALLYCFNHEERLTLFFQRHVVQRSWEAEIKVQSSRQIKATGFVVNYGGKISRGSHA